MGSEKHKQAANTRIHFGWWLWHKLNKHFNRDRAAMAEAMKVGQSRLRQYFLMPDSSQFPMWRAEEFEEILGMTPGTLDTAWRSEPVTEPVRDPRGRQPDAKPRVYRFRIGLPYALYEQAMAQADKLGMALDAVIIEAVEDWVARRKGSGEVILPQNKTRFSKRLPQEDRTRQDAAK